MERNTKPLKTGGKEEDKEGIDVDGKKGRSECKEVLIE